jgi:hypothetical protein
VVDKSLKSSILDFKPVSGRICILLIKSNFFNISLINVHAATEDNDDFIKEGFYQELERVYDSTAINVTRIILERQGGQINDPQRNYRGA